MTIVNPTALSVINLFFWVLLLAAFVVEAWAFFDVIRRPAAAFPAAGKQTKPIWLIILGVAFVIGIGGAVGVPGVAQHLPDRRVRRCGDLPRGREAQGQGTQARYPAGPLRSLVSLARDDAAGRSRIWALGSRVAISADRPTGTSIMTESQWRTHRLELDDQTLREWDAVVLDSGENGIVLDRSAFYPGGGGQPPDEGVLLWGGVQTRIAGARKGDDLYLIPAEGDPVPPAGTTVRGAVQDDRRTALMRTHSGLHVLCGVVFRDYGALVTGGNMEPLSRADGLRPARASRRLQGRGRGSMQR